MTVGHGYRLHPRQSRPSPLSLASTCVLSPCLGLGIMAPSQQKYHINMILINAQIEITPMNAVHKCIQWDAVDMEIMPYMSLTAFRSLYDIVT